MCAAGLLQPHEFVEVYPIKLRAVGRLWEVVYKQAAAVPAVCAHDSFGKGGR